MKYRLLLDIEVVEFLRTLSRDQQRRLRRRLGEIQDAPSAYADFDETVPGGRNLSVHVCLGFAIYFCDDLADRHVKVLHIRRADG